MSNITFNFSSYWPNVQVSKVIASPELYIDPETGYAKFEHGLGYPPLCIGYGSTYKCMKGLNVDETYIYVQDGSLYGDEPLDCAVIYPIDISKSYNYSYFASEIGEVVEDTSGGTLDLREFLIHSRAVSPMLLAVATKEYTADDLTLTYESPLSYPTFVFGYVKVTYTVGPYITNGTWVSVRVGGQAWPILSTDLYTSTLSSLVIDGELIADFGSIIALRNPAIISDNSVDVTI